MSWGWRLARNPSWMRRGLGWGGLWGFLRCQSRSGLFWGIEYSALTSQSSSAALPEGVSSVGGTGAPGGSSWQGKLTHKRASERASGDIENPCLEPSSAHAAHLLRRGVLKLAVSHSCCHTISEMTHTPLLHGTNQFSVVNICVII